MTKKINNNNNPILVLNIDLEIMLFVKIANTISIKVYKNIK